MIRMILALICLAGPLSAQVVTVRSGEHGDFTRIVLSLPGLSDWRIGRTEHGYEVELPVRNPNFNLSDVYRLITTDRLRAIWADPVTGRLQLGIGCACHVIPFEFGPRNLVIDIRPGAPPAESLFEIPLAGGAAMEVLAGVDPSRPRERPEQSAVAPGQSGYRWLDTGVAKRPAREPILPFATQPTALEQDATAAVTQSLTEGLDAEVDLAAFRELLVDQIGVGATQGVVDMQLPPSSSPAKIDHRDPEQARVALSTLPGLAIDGGGPTEGLQTDGLNCPAADRLALKDWSSTNDAASEIGAAKGTLLAEFDQPQAAQITTAARAHLYFGFGAEARNLLFGIANSYQPDPFLVAMSYLVDDERSPENPFARMQSCNSDAALWALLASQDGQPLDGLNGDAVARGAMELPNHLRRVFAPRIVARLMALGDPANAEVVQNALSRAIPKDDPTVHLLEAEIALTENKPSEAEAHLDALNAGEETLATLFSRVEARFQQGTPVDQADVLALEAFAFEQGSGEQKAAFQTALTRAHALTGAFEKAFGAAESSPPLLQDVWQILATSGTDSDILTHATGLATPVRESLPDDLRSALAERLLRVGLPNVATEFVHERSDARLAAEVSLANGDNRAALRAFAAALDKADPTLLANAYEGLGQLDAAAETLRAAGEEGQAARVDRWQGKWPDPRGDDADPWARLAGLATNEGEDQPLPPLRAAAAHLDRSIETRAGIEALLQSAPSPP